MCTLTSKDLTLEFLFFFFCWITLCTVDKCVLYVCIVNRSFGDVDKMLTRQTF